MKQSIAAHFSRIAAVLTLCALCALTLAAGKNEKTASPIDLNAYASLMSNRITRVEDLINRHYDQQDAFALLIPPGLELLNQPGNPDTLVIDLNSKELDATFTKALFSARPVYRNSVPAYEIALQETVQGTIEIRDNADQLLYTDPAPIGYVIPYELLFRQSQNPMLYYPELARYRLKTKLTLLPEQYAEHYLYAQARIAEAAALIQEEEGGGMMLMREGMEEEVYISGMREETNGLLLELSYPESYSGSVWSAYSYDARDTPSKTFMGLENVWTLISSNIVLTGETSVAWIDTRPMGFDEQTNPVHRFYAFGANTDSDNDGLNDGYELFVTKTNPNNPDSDGDGVNDADELTLGLDPNNPDDLPNVKGTIIYDGRQTNDIYVLAVQDDPYGWELDYAAALNAPGVYHLIALPPGTYYIKAWRDLNGNGRLDSEEAFGAYSNNPVIVTGQVTGVDFQLTEPDSDEDGVSDYIERAVFRANPYDSADIPPQLERQSGPCYYGHGTGSSVWQYAESNLGMLKFYPVGHGWVTNGVFIPDLSSPSELIYFGEAKGFPGYDSGGWVYSRSIALENYVDMGSGWIWADRFLTDHTVPSRIVRYLRPSPSGKPDLFVFSHSFNTEGDDVGFGWVRHGSFTADFSKPFSTIYQGLVQTHWTSTNMALRHTLPASRTWPYNKGTLGYGWATAAGFVPKSGLFSSYYYGVLKNSGGVVGYSTSPANFDDLGATISLGYGYLAGGDFLPLPGPSDPPVSEYDQDGDGFLDIPMDSPDQFAVIDDSEFLQLSVSIGDSSGSHTEMYGYRIGDFSYDMPYVNSSQYMFDSAVPLQRGKSYTGSFRSLSDDDDDGDYTFFVGESPSPGVVIVANFVFGAVEGSGFNSGSKPFTVHVPRVNIHAYQPGLLGSPGLEVTRFHEQRPYAVILPAYELAPPEVLSTNDGAVSRLRIEQFKPSALSNGTLRITISDTNVLALYDHNNKRASTLAYNLSTIVATNPLYYLKSADRVWHVLGLNPGAASVTLSYSDTNDMLICSDIIEFSVHDLAIVPDWNRDRSIDALDINQANAANPFRFWLNDDADTGDISEGDSDVSGRSGGLLGKANYENNKVDGRSDLEDFFPVWLNLGRTLAAFPPSGVVQYRLSQADGAVKAVYTDLRRNNAGAYLVSEGDSYGSLFSKYAHEANTFTISPAAFRFLRSS
ncbi:MAG: hypothetical protein M5U15_08485 [Kiritimatiellae bacterium]|nr:hypothetical protein [Kiritimatiellia bacterium]